MGFLSGHIAPLQDRIPGVEPHTHTPTKRLWTSVPGQALINARSVPESVAFWVVCLYTVACLNVISKDNINGNDDSDVLQSCESSMTAL